MDYYSLWPEVYQLHRITSTDVITVMKDIFSRHGIPGELVSDNGTQYKSHLFRKFITAWGIHHIISSPRYPQSNGLAEAAVKMTKAMIRKQVKTKQGITEGLLIIRNTPLQCGYSPAQLLMRRRLRDNLSCMPPSNSVTPKHDLTKEREVQERHFNNSTAKTSSSKFGEKQHVHMQHHITKRWSIDETVLHEVAPRSCEIQITDGTILKRNTKDIQKVYSLTSVVEPEYNGEDVAEDLEYSIDSDTETIVNDTFSDNDSDTIPYQESDSEVVPYKETDSDNEQYIDSPYMTKSDRLFKRKCPIDYEDL